MNDSALDLEPAFDMQKTRMRNQQPVFFKKTGSHDDVGDPGLVFETEKRESFGSGRSLPAYQAAGNFDGGAIGSMPEIRGAPEVGKAGAQQGHGMGAC